MCEYAKALRQTISSLERLHAQSATFQTKEGLVSAWVQVTPDGAPAPE